MTYQEILDYAASHGFDTVAVGGPLCYNRRKTKENDHGRME